MKWLITGGCGFIGSNLIKNIYANGSRDIRVVDNLSVGSSKYLEKEFGFKVCDIAQEIEPISGLDIITGNILDKELAAKSSIGADIIVHLARQLY